MVSVNGEATPAEPIGANGVKKLQVLLEVVRAAEARCSELVAAFRPEFPAGH